MTIVAVIAALTTDFLAIPGMVFPYKAELGTKGCEDCVKWGSWDDLDCSITRLLFRSPQLGLACVCLE